MSARLVSVPAYSIAQPSHFTFFNNYLRKERKQGTGVNRRQLLARVLSRDQRLPCEPSPHLHFRLRKSPKEQGDKLEVERSHFRALSNCFANWDRKQWQGAWPQHLRVAKMLSYIQYVVLGFT